MLKLYQKRKRSLAISVYGVVEVVPGSEKDSFPLVGTGRLARVPSTDAARVAWQMQLDL
jgi:hypothetical protein